MAYSINLSGKVALITGGAKGIGLATAKILAKAGAQVVIDDLISREKIEQELLCIERIGLKPDYFSEDISNENQVKDLVDKIAKKYNRIDFLINNAGVVSDWDISYAVHVKGIYYCSEAVRPIMNILGKGKIVNLSSTCVFTGSTGIPQYVATKGGTFALTHYLARTYAPFGILVNGIMPAVIMSDMIMTRYASEREMQEHYIPLMPIKRIGYPEDIAKIVLFLCSDLSDYICGEVIVADGGRMRIG
ncbi:MAG: SDR family oxidoreductase [Anaerolineaceae bacterium]|nr:SDR family oxidoreductase [Anaerolineaceae bacterium]